MRFLLDSNVISEMQRRSPSPKVLSWLARNESASAISDVLIGELVKGAWNISDAQKRDITLEWIREIEELFNDERLLPLDLPTLKTWGKISGINLQNGLRLAPLDSLIGAIAIQNDLTLVTRNVSDFPTDVRTFNPWD